MDNAHDRRPILTLAELRNFDPQAPGNRCWCPLCGENKPRDAVHRCLSFDLTTGHWKCFRCGSGGTLREFWREKTSSGLEAMGSGPSRVANGWGAPCPRSRASAAFALPTQATSALQVLAEQSDEDTETPKTIVWREKWEASGAIPGTAGAAYLGRRGISLEVAQWAGVRFCADWNAPEKAGKKRRALAAVVFPICSQSGDVVAAQARAISGSAKLTSGPKKEGVFFAPVRMASGKIFAPFDRTAPGIVITEAPLDAFSLAAAGFPAIALCGTNGPSWLHIACGLRRIFLALDADEAGDLAAVELETLLSPFGTQCTRLRPHDAKDWNEMLLKIGPSRLDEFLISQLLES